MKPRILFYVQHLLGIGHLMRACRIAKALSETFEVLLVIGGELPPGIAPEGVRLFRLPAVRAGAQGFGTLVHPDGSLFDDRDKAFVAICCSIVSTTSGPPSCSSRPFRSGVARCGSSCFPCSNVLSSQSVGP